MKNCKLSEIEIPGWLVTRTTISSRIKLWIHATWIDLKLDPPPANLSFLIIRSSTPHLTFTPLFTLSGLLTDIFMEQEVWFWRREKSGFGLEYEKQKLKLVNLRRVAVALLNVAEFEANLKYKTFFFCQQMQDSYAIATFKTSWTSSTVQTQGSHADLTNKQYNK